MGDTRNQGSGSGRRISVVDAFVAANESGGQKRGDRRGPKEPERDRGQQVREAGKENGSRQERTERHERRYPTKDDGLLFANWLKEGIALATKYRDTTASFKTEGEHAESFTVEVQGPKSILVVDGLVRFARMVAMSLGYRHMEMEAVPPPKEVRERLTEWFRAGCQAMVPNTKVTATSEATIGEKGAYLSVRVVCPEGAGRLIGKKGCTKEILLDTLRFVARGVGYNIEERDLNIDGADRNIFAVPATGTVGPSDGGTAESTGSDDPTSAGTGA
ncbi:MAG: hypothetical protein AAB562_02695 [Patescibacteria group bacterium]